MGLENSKTQHVARFHPARGDNKRSHSYRSDGWVSCGRRRKYV